MVSFQKYRRRNRRPKQKMRRRQAPTTNRTEDRSRVTWRSFPCPSLASILLTTECPSALAPTLNVFSNRLPSLRSEWAVRDGGRLYKKNWARIGRPHFRRT